MKRILLIISTWLLPAAALPADANFPPAQCMRQCELGTYDCEPREFEDFPDLDVTLLELAASCHSIYTGPLYAVEGVCMDGKRLLATGTGFTSEIRLYTAAGKFEGLITHTDVQSAPCMGQGFWPRYIQCDAPTVVTKLCALGGFEVGSPAFQNPWNE